MSYKGIREIRLNPPVRAVIRVIRLNSLLKNVLQRNSCNPLNPLLKKDRVVTVF